MSQLKSYLKYKDSEVEWIGKVPIDWGYTKLKRVATVELGSIDKKSRDNEIDILLCNYVDVYYNDIITSDLNFMKATAKQTQIDKFKLRHDDVVITKDSETPDDIGVPTWVSHDMENVVCGYHLAQIRTSENLVGKYLFYMLASTTLNKQLHSLAKGVTRYGISKGDIENSLFLKPKIETQRKIIYYLDKKTSQIDALIANKERLIELLEEKRQAVITETVTKGLDPNVKMKDSGIEWIGEIPAHWGISRIKYQSEINKRTLVENTDKSLSIKYIDIGSVASNGKIKSIESYSYGDAPSRAKRILIKGDTIVSTVRTYLKSISWIEQSIENLIGSTGFAVLSPKQSIEPEYLSYLMRTKNYIDELVARSVGVSYPATTADEVGNLYCILPSIEEQKEIINHITEVFVKIDTLIEKVNQQIFNLKEYREALIYEAVTGKIDVRDYAAEKEEVY